MGVRASFLSPLLLPLPAPRHKARILWLWCSNVQGNLFGSLCQRTPPHHLGKVRTVTKGKVPGATLPVLFRTSHQPLRHLFSRFTTELYNFTWEPHPVTSKATHFNTAFLIDKDTGVHLAFASCAICLLRRPVSGGQLSLYIWTISSPESRWPGSSIILHPDTFSSSSPVLVPETRKGGGNVAKESGLRECYQDRSFPGLSPRDRVKAL